MKRCRAHPHPPHLDKIQKNSSFSSWNRPLMWLWCECCYRGPTHRVLVDESYIHVPNLGASRWHFLTVILMMVWDLVDRSYIQVPNLGASWWRFLTDTLITVWVLVDGSYTQVPNLAGQEVDAFPNCWSWFSIKQFQQNDIYEEKLKVKVGFEWAVVEEWRQHYKL